jgi:hypothetical protein
MEVAGEDGVKDDERVMEEALRNGKQGDREVNSLLSRRRSK